MQEAEQLEFDFTPPTNEEDYEMDQHRTIS